MILNILETLTAYNQRFPEDSDTINSLQQLVAAGSLVTDRKEFLGHVTCGAILINQEKKVLMIHHIALDKWLFPGGHLEKEDHSLKEAAVRELCEETGIDKSMLKDFGNWLDQLPIHIDCHPIPRNKKKGEPEHKHWDFRYLFNGLKTEVTPQKNEIKGWAWVDLQLAPPLVFRRINALGLI